MIRGGAEATLNASGALQIADSARAIPVGMMRELSPSRVVADGRSFTYGDSLTSGVRTFDASHGRPAVGNSPTRGAVGKVWARAVSTIFRRPISILIKPSESVSFVLDRARSTAQPRTPASGKSLIRPCPQSEKERDGTKRNEPDRNRTQK